MSGERYQSVIAASGIIVGLQGFDHSEQTSRQKRACGGGGIHENKNIERIAIITSS